MAENTKLKIRCNGIDTADVITSAAGIAAATWTEQPLTLRDDELSIIEQDPTETDVYSHENDAPEDYSIVGNGLSAVGSFIKCSYAQMAELVGGSVGGSAGNQQFEKAAKKVAINKAFRFRLYGGGYIIIPNAKGFVNLSANLGAEDGMLKFPFSLRALAQDDWDCDLIIKLTSDIPGGDPVAPAMASAKSGK